MDEPISSVEDIQALIDKIEPVKKPHFVNRYNFEKFIAFAKYNFPDQYLYHKIKPSHVNGVQSKIIVVCKICNTDLPATVTSFLNGKKTCQNCHIFADDMIWDYKRFVTVSKNRFGPDNFNYDLILPYEKITGDLLIVITCNKCSTTFPITAKQHLKRKTGCFTCTKVITYDEIIARSKKYHKDTIDYSRVPRDIKLSTTTEFIVECKVCGYSWPTTVNNHLTKNCHGGCQNCSGRLPWTYEKFMSIVDNGSTRYDYSRIKPEDIKNQKSEISVGCTICGVFQNTTVQDHAYFKRQCLTCQNRAHWNLPRVLETGKALFKGKYDYSKVTEDMIVNNLSRIPVTCNDCGYHWTPKINSHLNDRKGCTECANHKLWSYLRFLQEAEKIHDGAYDYSEIDPNVKLIGTTNIPIRCKKCNHRWIPTVGAHIYERNGCSNCRRSKGEKATEIALKELAIELGIVWDDQFKISPYDFKYDFVFQYQNKNFVLEFDGRQHFEESEFFKQIGEIFEKRHQTDLFKTHLALEHGFQVIRIDHTQLKHVKEHILEAVRLDQSLYYTDSELYHDFPKL